MELFEHLTIWEQMVDVFWIVRDTQKFLEPLNCVQKKSWSWFRNVINKMNLQIIYLKYMYKQDLSLNNLQWLICHKILPTKTKFFINKNNDHIRLFRDQQTTEWRWKKEKKNWKKTGKKTEKIIRTYLRTKKASNMELTLLLIIVRALRKKNAWIWRKHLMNWK